MQSARAILPQVNIYPSECPIRYPYCGCGILHRQGEFPKRVKDIYEAEVTTIRYLCVGCVRVFTLSARR